MLYHEGGMEVALKYFVYLAFWHKVVHLFFSQIPISEKSCIQVWKVKSVSVSHSVMSNSLWPHGCSRPSSSVHEILQATVLEWLAIPFSRGCSWPGGCTWVSCIAGRFFTAYSFIILSSIHYLSIILLGHCPHDNKHLDKNWKSIKCG